MQIVGGHEDMLLVTESGVMIRTAVDNVRTAGRATQGVIVMRFKEEGDRVIAMALTAKEEDSTGEEGE
jgi:DNA gyrase subunit A